MARSLWCGSRELVRVVQELRGKGHVWGCWRSDNQHACNGSVAGVGRILLWCERWCCSGWRNKVGPALLVVPELCKHDMQPSPLSEKLDPGVRYVQQNSLGLYQCANVVGLNEHG